MSGDDSSLSLRAPARETVFRPFPLASSSGALYIARMYFLRPCINQSVHYLRLYRSLYSNKFPPPFRYPSILYTPCNASPPPTTLDHTATNTLESLLLGPAPRPSYPSASRDFTVRPGEKRSDSVIPKCGMTTCSAEKKTHITYIGNAAPSVVS